MTTHRPPSTVHRPPSILLAIILFIILRNPMPTMAHNHLAIHTIAACPGHATSQPTYDHTTWPQAWLAAALAHCQGNTTQARIAWQQVITHTNARLQAIRAALPDDLPLAQLAATQHPTSATAHFWHGAALTTHLTNQQTHQSSNHQTIQQAIHAYQTALTLQIGRAHV